MAAAPSPPLTVAVIGGGPGGMFFCHAIESYRRAMKEKGDELALANLPDVTCFERASGPGGVWKAARTSDLDETKESETTNMYQALWTNGPKEAIEFFDYTFDEYFTHPLPVYMPRHAMLEYMIGRVTKHCPDFFEKYMSFNTSVESVRFVDSKRKFEVVTRHVLTGEELTKDFDKCIWAAGMNGRPMIPTSMVDMFHEGNFSGRIIHSSETANFEDDVKGKRILLIGGSYSAEDLALMAIKCGVERVYVSSRHSNVINWTSMWPYGKVEVLAEQLPVRVTDNGRCIQFAATETTLSDKYVPGEDIETELHDIDTVIFCTGYLPNLDMLSEELRQAASRDEDPVLLVPREWRMTTNKFTDVLGNVEPADDVQVTGCSYPGLYYDCISIENPCMMFLKFEFENPLFGIDVSSLLLMQFVLGFREIPSAEEMLEQEKDNAPLKMNNPWYRCMMDKNYFEAMDGNWEKFVDKPKSKLELLDEFELDFEETTEVRVLTRYTEAAGYPVSLGTYDELNETAEAFMEFDRMTYCHRAQLTENDAENGRTFRDCSNGDEFRSVFTGSGAVSLKQRWLDIDANDAKILDP